MKPTKKQLIELARVTEEAGMRTSSRFELGTTNLHVDEKSGECTLALTSSSGVVWLVSPSGASQKLGK